MPASPPEPFVSAAVLVEQAAKAAPVAVPVMIGNAEQALAAIGQPVRVQGVAEDSKLSAVVLGEALVVHLMARDEQGLLVETRWPEGVTSRPVMVTGTLERSDQFAVAHSPDGAISQGAEGSILALVDWQHELLEPEPEPVPAEPEAPSAD